MRLSLGFCSATFFIPLTNTGVEFAILDVVVSSQNSMFLDVEKNVNDEGWRLHILMARNNGFLLLLCVVDYMVLLC